MKLGLSFLKDSLFQKDYRRKFLLDHFRKSKFIAVVTGLSLFFQLVEPNVALALTGGPASPDFASFEPVATTNMVNEFTGQFAYNIPVIEIPGANGAGYAMSLSYHSGDGPEAEASWVGYGWSLNPGTINRVKRGVPDDYKNKEITYYQDMPKNWTIAGSSMHHLEAYSVMAGVTNTLRYNNYKGFSHNKKLGLSLLSGVVSLGYNFSAGQGTWSVAVNPAQLVSFGVSAFGGSLTSAGSASGRQSSTILKNGTGLSMYSAGSRVVGGATSEYIGYLLTDMTGPYNVMPYEGYNISAQIQATGNVPPVQIGFSTGVNVGYTSIKSIPQRNVQACGFMYSSYSNGGMMDYTVENESVYNPRDLFMPVPTSTPDAFFVSGEGLGGAFRMYNDRVGIFSPNAVTSSTEIDFYGVDLHLGWTFGVGGDLSRGGSQELTVGKNWSYGPGNTDSFWHAPYEYSDSFTHEAVFFRFNNDLGGKVDYDGNDGLNWTYPSDKGPLLGCSERIQKSNKIGAGTRSGRASYVGYHTNKEAREKSAKNTLINAYERNDRINYLSGRQNISNNTNLDDEIGEISVYNEDGNNYVYGLPVYASGDKSMLQGIQRTSGDNYIAKGSFNTKKIGEQYNISYPTAYLLTQITTPDYVDLDLNGPDTGDFGGYTRFMYKPIHWMSTKGGAGMEDMLYKWRVPYQGAYFNHMRFSDPDDDMGAYQSGLKEVYVLDTIETQTHYAVFITDTVKRKDSWSAKLDDEDAAKGLGYSAIFDKPMKALKRIELYAKSPDTNVKDKLIKTVRFQYDYSAWPNVDNNRLGTSGSNGKLTLKRVWFEYNGVVNASVSPYEFEYTYPNVTYPSRYKFIEDEMNNPSVNQTPNYSPYIDAWGNYQDDGANRRNNLRSWTSQKPSASFDPAAWQLKRIILPSGGEIHVQYEQNSYAAVQDKAAYVMLNLKGDPREMAEGTRFQLDLSGLSLSGHDKSRLVDYIKAWHKPNATYMYYKFYYSLLGSDTANFNTCKGEYFDGFASVTNAFIDHGEIYVDFAMDAPHQTCIDYVHKEIGGNLRRGDCGVNGPSDPASNGARGKTLGEKLHKLGESLINSIGVELAANKVSCLAINPRLSYLRIPFWNKKGGGVRVKRLMMYDEGVETNTQSLYGTEYVYENLADNTSYGVATNEPIENKEENPLVDYLVKRYDQSNNDRLFQGRDVDQFRGPLSMNALPAASIGYSKVIKKNIHQDKYTGTGYTEMNYYTAKDYPVSMEYSPVYKNPDLDQPEIGLFSYTMHSTYSATQAYVFKQNQMHGQIRAVKDYAGEFDNSFFTSPPDPVAAKFYDYFLPGQYVPMFDFDGYDTYNDQSGKETDITIDRRSVSDVTNSTRWTADLTYAQVGPISLVYPVAFPIISGSNNVFNSMVVNKTIHYPAILKWVTEIKDGYSQRTEFIGYDPQTGKPAVTRTYDGYHKLNLWGDSGKVHAGHFTQYNIPASSQYNEMGQKAMSERYIYRDFEVDAGGTGPTANIPGVNAFGYFTVGDLVAIHGPNTRVAHVIEVNGPDIKVERAGMYNSSLSDGKYDKIEIIRSAHTNQLTASSGGYLEYGGQLAGGSSNIKRSKLQFVTDLNDSLRRLMNGGVDTMIIDMSKYKGKFLYGNFRWDDLCWRVPQQQVFYLELSKAWVAGKWKYSATPLDASYNEVPYAWPSAFVNLDLTHAMSKLPMNFPRTMGFSYKGSIWGTTGNPHQYLLIYPLHDTVRPWGYEWGRWCPEGGSGYGGTPVQGVLKASVTKYKDDWPYDTTRYLRPSNLNLFEQGMKGKWRPFETYVLRDTAYPGSDPTLDQRNYKAAGMSYNFELGPRWVEQNDYYPHLWVRTDTVYSCSPHGYATEEHNAHDIPSTAKFGYSGLFPYMVTKNATYNSIRFESFERTYNHAAPKVLVEDGVRVPTGRIRNYAHTGLSSLLLQANQGKADTSKVLTFHAVEDLEGKGHVVRFWANVIQDDVNNFVNSMMKVKANGSTMKIRYVGRSGRGSWALFEARFTGTLGAKKYKYEFYVDHNDAQIYIDDIIIQPVGAKSSAFVYDTRTSRLSATFDEDHFALINIYNGEGKLVRKMKETFQGSVTNIESQSHTPERKTRQDIGNN